MHNFYKEPNNNKKTDISFRRNVLRRVHRPSLPDGNVDTDLLIHQVHCCVNQISISMKIDFDIFEGTVLNLI